MPKTLRRVNITFHGIGEPSRPLAPGERNVWISLDEFTSILDEVKEHEDVNLSFDDGNISDIRYGLPALLERRLTATFFVLAGRLNTPEFLDAEDLRALAEAGMRIGCHGMHHVSWRGLDSNQFREELETSRKMLIEITGQSVVEAACPFGDYDRRSLAVLRKCQYSRVYTSDDGVARSDRWLQPRNSVTTGTGVSILQQAVARRSVTQGALREIKLAVKRWR